MVTYLIDKQEARNITIFYSNKTYRDIAYRDIFAKAQQNLGIRTIYTIENPEDAPADFNFKQGVITKELIMQEVPDFKERMFYISGPRSMIVSFSSTLKKLGVPKHHIK